MEGTYYYDNVFHTTKILKNRYSTISKLFLVTFRMFQEHDDLRKFFKFGDYKESSDLLQNKIFQNHVMLVMHTFDEAICSMGDTDYVMEMLRGVGKSHRRLPEFNFLIFSVSLCLVYCIFIVPSLIFDSSILVSFHN